MINGIERGEFVRGFHAVQEHVAQRERLNFADRSGADYNVGERIALVHSEISEALEAVRKNLMDDHLPERAGLEVELADAIIRMMGIAEHYGYDIASALLEKADYNDVRADHQAAARFSEHGKRF